MREIHILLADDHEVVRKGLRALLEAQPGWKVIAEAVDGRDAVEKAKELRPDVAIVDIGMPCLNGLEATRQIMKKAPRTRVLILTMHDTNPLIQQVVKAGARGTDASRWRFHASVRLCAANAQGRSIRQMARVRRRGHDPVLRAAAACTRVDLVEPKQDHR